MRDLSDRKSPRRRTVTRRSALVGLVGTGVFATLGARLYHLQIVQRDEYATLSDDNRFFHQLSPASRGRILDRYGAEIAGNRENFQVFAIPHQVGDLEEGARAVLAALDPSGLVDSARHAALVRSLRNSDPYKPVLVAENVAWEPFTRVNIMRPELPGVAPQVGETRAYGLLAREGSRRDADAFAHIVGYVSKPPERIIVQRLEDARNRSEERRLVRELRHPAARVGRSGVEQTMDQALRGQWGELRVEMDARGRVVREIGHDQEPVAGQDINLTLDAEVQVYAQNRLYGESGAVAAMDVRTGEIICLASAPGFDPNLFASGISARAFRALRNDERAPLYNKPLAGLYAPGSTFKMVTALAALRESVVTPSDRVYCSGKIRLGNREFHCWKEEGHGWVDLRLAIKRSCDCYFYEMAQRLYRRSGKPDALEEVAMELGVGGAAFGIEAPGGRDGIVPGPGYDQRVRAENLTVPGYNKEVDDFHRALQSRRVRSEDDDSEDQTPSAPKWYIDRATRFLSAMDGYPLPSTEWLNDEDISADRYNALVSEYNARVSRHNGLAREFNSEIVSYANQFRFKQRLQARLPRLSLGDRLNEAIGQGYVLASPLQLAVMTARLATGRKVEPVILKDQVAPETERDQHNISPEHLALVQDAMMGVVEEPFGTANYALEYKGIDIPGVRMAGKTGSSQVFRITEKERREGVREQNELPWRRRDHGLFVAYAPFDSPRYAIALIVEHGGGGSTSAARPARDILKRILERDPTPLAGLADGGSVG